MIKKSSIIFFLLLVFISCENEIDLYDEFAQMPVVYGLVNPNDSTHIIRINKTFMPDYNPKEALFNSDLKTFDQVEAKVEEWNSDQLINSYTLQPYLGSDNPFLETYTNNPLYFFNTRLKPNLTYKLIISSPDLAETAIGTTDIIGELTYFYTQQYYIDFSEDTRRAIVRWRAPNNATIFLMSFVFEYYEIANNDTTIQTVKQVLYDDRFRGLEDDQPVVTVITGRVFYDMIKEQIPVKSNVKRIATPPKFEIKMGGEEMYDIIISAAAKDLDYPIYENGQYSNIENGQGIFTSIYDTTITKRYTPKTLDSLASRADMLPYKFENFIIE